MIRAINAVSVRFTYLLSLPCFLYLVVIDALRHNEKDWILDVVSLQHQLGGMS